MKTGKVKWYNDKKKFGFITGDDGQDVFLHASDLPVGPALKEGDRVKFEIGACPKGEKAVNVERV